MTHQPYDDSHETFTDIIARDERNPSFGKQVLNGIGGMLTLLVTGMLIVLLVLWKSP